MKARYNYRFYPTDQQKHDLSRLFGCVRVVFNDALALCKSVKKKPSGGDLQKLCITQAKRTEQREWLSLVSNVALQQSIADLETAYKNFFESCSGKRKGKKVRYPKFKKKSSAQSARFTRNGFSLDGEGLYIAKIGLINPIWSRELPSSPSSVTVIKDAANRYFVSFVVEIVAPQIPAKNQSVGIDLGIKTFAALSNGEMVQAPNLKRLDRRVRRLQKQLARCKDGSNRRQIVKLKIAKAHCEIRELRKDFQHKLSTRLTSQYQVIVLEDLNVSGMMKNRKLARAIGMQAWYQFRAMLTAKCTKLGRKLHVISRWEPTSQICSSCGFKWGKLDLSIRTVKCLNCGETHDRDLNAAINIQQVGMGHRHDSKCA